MAIGNVLNLPDYKLKFSLRFERMEKGAAPDPKAKKIQTEKPPGGGWAVSGEEKIDWNRLILSGIAPVIAQVGLVFLFKRFPVGLAWNIGIRYVASIAAIFVGGKVYDMFDKKQPEAPARTPFKAEG